MNTRALLAALVAPVIALGLAAGPAAADMPAPRPGAEVYLRPADGAFDIVGGGFGHGTGMSQYGADGAARAGLGHEAILQHYYPGAALRSGPTGPVAIGLTVDSDGVVEVAARPGLGVSAGPSGSRVALPSGRDRWRVRSLSSQASSCVLEGRRQGATTWERLTVTGISGCPITFSSSEGTVDLLVGSTWTVYRGTVTATHRGTTSLIPVNRLSREHYLRSVVAAEMPQSFRPAALRAQAVSARTYVARRANGTTYYDTCDTTRCQVYRGMGTRKADGSVASWEYAAPRAAVDATAGQILVDGAGAPITTMYSSSNGGWMKGVDGFSYLVSKADPYDAVDGNRRHRWEGRLPAAELERRHGLARLERIQITRRDGAGAWGGRVLGALVEGYDRSGRYQAVTVTGSQLQAAWSFPSRADGLSSTYFTIRPEAPAATRIAGRDLWGTAAAVSSRWEPGVDVVYLASGTEFPDALVAASWSGVTGGPVLLTPSTSLPTAVRSELARLRPRRIVVLGGTMRVSDAVLREARSYATSGTAQRVAGSTRYGTAAQVAASYPVGVDTVYLASGQRFPDALGIAALAAHQEQPLLLTASNALPRETREALARLRPRRVVVVGGPLAVSADVLAAARRYTSAGTAERWAGRDLYATSAEIALRWPASDAIWLASGERFPDALVGAARAGQEGQPLLLTRRTSLSPTAAEVMAQRRPSRLVVLGGELALSGSVYDSAVTRLR